MRHDNTTTSKTLLEMMTDEMLFVELSDDPLLRSYDFIQVDEVHARNNKPHLLKIKVLFLRRLKLLGLL